MKKIFAVILSCMLAVCAVPSVSAYSADGELESITGDVNADGQFTVADVVTMQKWLIAVPDVRLNDWEAGDLYKDERIDVFDLCLMKRLLVQSSSQNSFDSLIGMEYKEAVQNAYISKSEYNYQITGNLKRSIEEKMGRPLDYSVDRFYLVNNEKFGLNGDTKYLYNSGTADVYAVNEETKMNRATWYWKGSKAALYGLDDDTEKQNELLDALEFYGITEIYYSIGANKLVNSKEMVETFVKNAYARDMKVYLLNGENTWLYEDSYQKAIYNIFNKVEEYNGLVDYNARLAGVSYDAEVWINSEYDWKNNDSARAQQVKFIETAQQYADSKNLSVSYCLPFWIVQYDYTDDEGITQNVYDSITQIANDTILMVYRDSAEAVEKLVTGVQNNAENSVFYYVEKNDCNLEIAVEINETTEGDHVTFYEEELENPGCVTEAIAVMQNDLKLYQYRTTFAIHHAIVMYERYLDMNT
ncbi:MAG: dockerin type I repeat-containing protein [Ruminococcus flavefaciens]|nr:dockerin type I repeat-containing protein [Ruminococcus flavefaciens]MCM1230403.1 dockerin type I repeat-containing protein [Ruminococcus flavefaciens]